MDSQGVTATDSKLGPAGDPLGTMRSYIRAILLQDREAGHLPTDSQDINSLFPLNFQVALTTHTRHKNKQFSRCQNRIKMQAFRVGAISMPRMVCSFRRTQDVRGRCAGASTAPAMASLGSPHLNWCEV